MTTPSAPTTTRLIIVCSEAVRQQMNDTLNTIDPSSTGDVMVVPVALETDPTVAVGRWASWAMDDATHQAVLKAYAQQGWRPLQGSEGTVHQPGDVIPAWGTQRFWLFDGLTWERPHDALAALGLVVWDDGGE